MMIWIMAVEPGPPTKQEIKREPKKRTKESIFRNYILFIKFLNIINFNMRIAIIAMNFILLLVSAKTTRG